MKENGISLLNVNQAAVLEGQYDQADAYNAVESIAKGVSHCEKMKSSLNKQFQPQVCRNVCRTISAAGHGCRALGGGTPYCTSTVPPRPRHTMWASTSQ